MGEGDADPIEAAPRTNPVCAFGVRVAKGALRPKPDEAALYPLSDRRSALLDAELDLKLTAQLANLIRRELAHELRGMRALVVSLERQQVERRQVEPLGQARDRLNGDRGKPVLHAREMPFRQLTRICEVCERHTSLCAKLTNARTYLTGERIRN